MRRATVDPLAIGAVLLVVASGAAAQEQPYPPAAKLEQALGGLGSRAGARWYDPGTRTISSTDPFLSNNATTAFNLAPFPSLCPSGVGPGSPCASSPAPIGADVYGRATIEMLGGVVKCRCTSP